MRDFAMELWAFMKERKKFWLLPIVVVLVPLLVAVGRDAMERIAARLTKYVVVRLTATASDRPSHSQYLWSQRFRMGSS